MHCPPVADIGQRPLGDEAVNTPCSTRVSVEGLDAPLVTPIDGRDVAVERGPRMGDAGEDSSRNRIWRVYRSGGRVDMGEPRVLEVRVHGIANAPPADMLLTEPDGVVKAEGDALGSFWQRKGADPANASSGLAEHRVEAYSWGNQARTGGSALALIGRAFVHLGWLFILPFALCNLAYWSRRSIPGPTEHMSRQRSESARTEKPPVWVGGPARPGSGSSRCCRPSSTRRGSCRWSSTSSRCSASTRTPGSCARHCRSGSTGSRHGVASRARPCSASPRSS